MSTGYMVSFNYTNHRGEFTRRTVELESVDYLKAPGFGYEPGWFLSGICQDKKARRSFAFANIKIPLDHGNCKLVDILIAQGKKS